MREKYDSILASEEFEIFRPYRNVLSKLCVLSMLAKDEVTIEQYIEKRQLEIEKNEREIEQTEQQLKTIDVHEFIQKDIEYFEYEQLSVFREKEDRIDAELRAIREKLENFEEKFFADLPAAPVSQQR